MKKASHNLALGAMLLINLAALVFLTTVMKTAVRDVTDSFEALNFLDSLVKLPISPVTVQTAVLALFVLLAVLTFMQAGNVLFGERATLTALNCAVQILLCVAVMYLLDFQYNGLLFIPMANIIVGLEKNSFRLPLLLAGIAAYLFLSYDILSGSLALNDFDNYMTVFGANTQTVLYGSLNLLTGLNIMIFIVFMAQALQSEFSETMRLKELNAQVSRSAEELKVINLQLEEYALQSEKNAQIRERNRIAREIHDTLGHTLTGIAAAVDACIELVGKDPPRLKKQLTLVSEAARSGLVDVRRSVSALRPDTLERFSLGEALRKMADEINETTNIDVELTYEHGRNSDEAKEIIYRIVQESITNSVRHGAASLIRVNISLDGPNTLVHVADNGASCEAVTEGFGLMHMRERVESLGGTITFGGHGDLGGFVTDASVPRRRGDNND